MQAAAGATLSVDFLIHPMDTLITRMQSPMYTTQYKSVNGAVSRTLFLGLYQGFGPTIITSIPSSAAFFTIYEGLKGYSLRAKEEGRFSGVPLPVLYGASGAAASLVSCAITNPAEVLKQNAQVYKGSGSGASPTIATLRRFAKQPTKLWAGYTALVASDLPNTTLMFCLYETLKERFLGGDSKSQEGSVPQQVLASGLCAAVAGSVSSSLFVPIDVVKTRMRLAAGGEVTGENGAGTTASTSARAKIGPIAVAKGIVLKEGVRGLFRGVTVTVLASAFGGGLYIGCYEAIKIYLS
ncbi:mitochondrial carrier domain-containing protein [Colletotrichum godetiae]|uniref:Mitochondrial carrier domain-containing protein n=1 Tax=Colletotrichum godetiae TaxID=1209918 RepID=A0AAJ0AZS2_9PEZI|nr:mitochondrial carrier domain-containing protein [Colletotrichum godetiae]KAK1701210.1 mitochondrial carrier domain-containing protein [Colletotrichum godetiae]